MDSVKVKVTRSDGVVVELEGKAEEVAKVLPSVLPGFWNLVNQQQFPLAGGGVQQFPLAGGGVQQFPGLKFY